MFIKLQIKKVTTMAPPKSRKLAVMGFRSVGVCFFFTGSLLPRLGLLRVFILLAVSSGYPDSNTNIYTISFFLTNGKCLNFHGKVAMATFRGNIQSQTYI